MTCKDGRPEPLSIAHGGNAILRSPGIQSSILASLCRYELSDRLPLLRSLPRLALFFSLSLSMCAKLELRVPGLNRYNLTPDGFQHGFGVFPLSMVSLGIIFYFCLYNTQENIKNNIFIMVLRGAELSWHSIAVATS